MISVHKKPTQDFVTCFELQDMFLAESGKPTFHCNAPVFAGLIDDKLMGAL